MHQCIGVGFTRFPKEEQSGGTRLAKVQINCAILAEFRQLDTHKLNFHFCSENSPNLTCYITSRVHNINCQSTIPPLRSFLGRSNKIPTNLFNALYTIRSCIFDFLTIIQWNWSLYEYVWVVNGQVH